MKKIGLHGSYYSQNFGDEIILSIQSKWIEEKNTSIVYLPLASAHYKTVLKKDVNTKLKELSGLIYGAGGYFGEPNKSKFKWGFMFLLRHYLPAIVSIMKKKEYCINGTGVGPISNPLTKAVIKTIISRAKSVVVRDIESYNHIRKWNIKSEIIVTCDIALSLDRSFIPELTKYRIESLFPISESSKIGIHITSPIKGKDSIKTIKLLDLIINYFNEKKSLIPVIFMDNNNKSQRYVYKYLKDNLREKGIYFEYEDYWSTTAIISKLDFVITTKLHVGIVAYSLGVIPIGVPIHSKTTRFYKQIDRENYCMPFNNFEPNKFIDILNEQITLGKKNIINESYSNKMKSLKDKALINKIYLENFIDNL